MKNSAAVLLFSFLFLSQSLFAQSDAQAIELADDVIEAMGGAENWEATRFIHWNFFGKRPWYWDKHTGDVRCEIPKSDVRIAMNIHDMTGVVYAHGVIQTETDSLAKYLKSGYDMWINDSYWFVMPFKLRDPGVTLKSLGEKSDANGKACDVIQLTFEEVGVTPQNKYWIYIAPETHLVVQWDYFSHFDNEAPNMTTAWSGYQTFGKILLSSGRGGGIMSDIAVYKKLPSALFSDVSRSATDILD